MSIVTLNDRGVRSVTTFGSLNTGSMVFIKKLTASSSSTLSFVNGSSDVVLDSTYKEYVFTFNNIHPSGETTTFEFNLSVDSGSTSSDSGYFYLDLDGSSNTYNITQSSTLARDYLKIISSGSNSNICVIQNDSGTSTSC